MPDQQIPYFNPEYVGKTFYINLNRADDRNERFGQMAREIGLRAERIEGIDAAALDEDVRKDIVARMKNKVVIGGRLEDTLEENCVPEKPERMPDALETTAYSKYGCAASHVKAMQRALATIRPGDEEKWIVILEDDAVLSLESRAEINRILAEAPDDAGAMMLGVMHPRGAVPLATDSPDIMQPTKGNATVAIAFRPDMMLAMLKVYERNLQMTREEGGISPVDNINAVIHQYLAFQDEAHLGRPEYSELVEVFRKATQDLKQHKFYAANPSLVRPLDEVSRVSGNHNAHLVRENPLHVCDGDIARQIQQKVNGILRIGLDKMRGGVIDDPMFAGARREMKSVIGKTAYTGELSPEQALEQLERLEARVAGLEQASDVPQRRSAGGR